jgi:hypothetical protein
MLVFPALGRLRQQDLKFNDSLGYTGRHSLKQQKEVIEANHQLNQSHLTKVSVSYIF